MKKSNIVHKCVFTRAERDFIRLLPATVKGISGKMNLIIALFIAIVGLTLVPVGFMLSQATDIGKLLSATEERHQAALRYRERENKKILDLKKAVEKAGKKSWWAEKHTKDTQEAIEKLNTKFDLNVKK